MHEEQRNLYAPPGSLTSADHLDPDSLLRKRLRRILYIHLASVCMLFVVTQYESIFLSGGGIAEFLILFPLSSTFYACPIATVLAIWPASNASIWIRGFAIVADLTLSVLQFFIVLPGVQ